jgi:fatty acyl-ACP thioesterase B
MTLEYRRECGRNSVLQSLTDVSGADIGNLSDGGFVECNHLLRLNDGAEIVRGRTEWRPKPANNFDILNQVPSQNT